MSFDNLGDRMKDYENVSRIKFTKKSPVIIRLDGKAFHTFTKGFERPFDIQAKYITMFFSTRKVKYYV